MFNLAGEKRQPGWHLAGFVGLCGGLILFAMSWEGCGAGGASATLSGEVSFAGEPIRNGSIRLDPVNGKGIPVSTQISDGKYSFAPGSGLVAGSYRVSITAVRVLAETEDPETGQKVQQTEQYIPDKYNTRTTLQISISGGTNTQNFALEP